MLVTAVSILPALLGCQLLSRRSPHETTSMDSQAPSAPVAVTGRAPASAIAPALAVVDLVFEVTRLEFPAEHAGDARKLWNHVDEMRADPDTLARLGRNAIRIGVGNPSSTSALNAIARAAGASASIQPMVAPRGLPVELPLGVFGEEETVFTFGFDRRLAGKSFPAGERRLLIDYLFKPENQGSTELVLTWEIRHDKGTMTWERSEGTVRQAPDIDRHMFGELASRWSLARDEFLVIGVGDGSHRDFMVGNRFLAEQRDGKRVGTVLLIAPKPFQTNFAGPETGG